MTGPMTGLPLVDVGKIAPETRELLDRLPARLNLFYMLAHAETCLRPVMSLGSALLKKLDLDPLLREIAMLRAMYMVGGEYEIVQHVPIAAHVGCSAAQLEALKTGVRGDGLFSPVEIAVLDFTEDLTANTRVSDAVLSALREHLGDREVVELILVIGFYSMMAKVTESTRTTVDAADGIAIATARR